MNIRPPVVSLIVAMSENGVIGRRGDLPWHLSQDLRRFKRLTLGHSIVMGRKTFDSIRRLLPGRTTIILTRQGDLLIEGAVIVGSLSAALEASIGSDEVFIVGGSEIFRQAIPLADKIYVTRVHTVIEDGDTRFPDLQWDRWQLIESESGQADEKNDFDYTFETYERRNQTPVDQADAKTIGCDRPR